MSVIFLIVPVAFFIAAAAVMAFVWSVKSGQLDDMDTPAVRMLFDDDESPVQNESLQTESGDDVSLP